MQAIQRLGEGHSAGLALLASLPVRPPLTLNQALPMLRLTAAAHPILLPPRIRRRRQALPLALDHLVAAGPQQVLQGGMPGNRIFPSRKDLQPGLGRQGATQLASHLPLLLVVTSALSGPRQLPRAVLQGASLPAQHKMTARHLVFLLLLASQAVSRQAHQRRQAHRFPARPPLSQKLPLHLLRLTAGEPSTLYPPRSRRCHKASQLGQDHLGAATSSQVLQGRMLGSTTLPSRKGLDQPLGSQEAAQLAHHLPLPQVAQTAHPSASQHALKPVQAVLPHKQKAPPPHLPFPGLLQARKAAAQQAPQRCQGAGQQAAHLLLPQAVPLALSALQQLPRAELQAVHQPPKEKMAAPPSPFLGPLRAPQAASQQPLRPPQLGAHQMGAHLFPLPGPAHSALHLLASRAAFKTPL